MTKSDFSKESLQEEIKRSMISRRKLMSARPTINDSEMKCRNLREHWLTKKRKLITRKTNLTV